MFINRIGRYGRQHVYGSDDERLLLITIFGKFIDEGPVISGTTTSWRFSAYKRNSDGSIMLTVAPHLAAGCFHGCDALSAFWDVKYPLHSG